MIEKTVNISGQDVKFRSSATVPRLYRIKFKRDIFKDLSKLEKAYNKKSGKDEDLQINDPEILELWGANMVTDIEAKKGLEEVSGK